MVAGRCPGRVFTAYARASCTCCSPLARSIAGSSPRSVQTRRGRRPFTTPNKKNRINSGRTRAALYLNDVSATFHASRKSPGGTVSPSPKNSGKTPGWVFSGVSIFLGHRQTSSDLSENVCHVFYGRSTRPHPAFSLTIEKLTSSSSFYLWGSFHVLVRHYRSIFSILLSFHRNCLLYFIFHSSI